MENKSPSLGSPSIFSERLHWLQGECRREINKGKMRNRRAGKLMKCLCLSLLIPTHFQTPELLPFKSCSPVPPQPLFPIQAILMVFCFKFLCSGKGTPHFSYVRHFKVRAKKGVANFNAHLTGCPRNSITLGKRFHRKVISFPPYTHWHFPSSCKYNKMQLHFISWDEIKMTHYVYAQWQL